MDLTSYKMKVAIVYTSVTGNTLDLAQELYRLFLRQTVDIVLYQIVDFPLSQLRSLDGVVIGSYTWGSGEIPREMWGLYDEIASLDRHDWVSAVFGTGDSLYPNYCGAVDRFRDMLYVHTNLAATLKVELAPQIQDGPRCQRFVESVIRRVGKISFEKSHSE
ncbi:flavodoxin domain-containing protein [Neobacillus jeddahensis]|uniref:flavodoxin domain-containing protein n=1 Tax=Neobacillus jeddahensis TaxID=1461580 RepID=UPI001FCBDF6E|nr:flavodoxin domain-containing protein [Neobacillus jeddahensis]